MAQFFNICDYFDLTPAEFFDGGLSEPQLTTRVCRAVRTLDADAQELLLRLIGRIRR